MVCIDSPLFALNARLDEADILIWMHVIIAINLVSAGKLHEFNYTFHQMFTVTLGFMFTVTLGFIFTVTLGFMLTKTLGFMLSAQPVHVKRKYSKHNFHLDMHF